MICTKASVCQCLHKQLWLLKLIADGSLQDGVLWFHLESTQFFLAGKR